MQEKDPGVGEVCQEVAGEEKGVNMTYKDFV